MAKRKNKVRLGEKDWEQLFPGEDFTIAGTTLVLAPMSIETLSHVLRKVSTIAEQLPAVSVSAVLTGENDANNMVGFVAKIMEEAPEVLSDMSGLHTEDVKELPLETAIDLFAACVDINLRAKEALLKNLKRLGEGVAQISPESLPVKKLDPIGEVLAREAV